jgi:DNA-binding transcriptional MerR regulator
VITLQQLEAKNPSWSLEEFVAAGNAYLPRHLLPPGTGSKIQEEVNARLIRHYTGIGLIDRPRREGKEVRYGFRHLLQLLVLRRLLQEGYTSQSIAGITASRSDEELEALLQGGVRLTLEPANPALAFLKEIRARGTSTGEPPVLSRRSPAPALSAPVTHPGSTGGLGDWTRVDLAPGVELHIRQDFVWPGSPQEQKNLLELIAQNLSRVAGKRRRSR